MVCGTFIQRLALGGLLIASIVSCGRSEAGAAPASFLLDGPINQAAFQAFTTYRDAYPERPISMIMRSPGGDARWAMQLGDAMREAGVDLRIRGVCHSACIQYVVPSARKVIVDPETSIAFHSSPSTLQLPGDAPERPREQLRAFQEQEAGFYTERGIDREMLFALQALLDPICRISIGEAPGPELSAYGAMFQFAAVVPSRELLQAIGYRQLEGYWPADYEQSWRDARDAGANMRLLTLRYVGAPRLEPDAVKMLPPCPKPGSAEERGAGTHVAPPAPRVIPPPQVRMPGE